METITKAEGGLLVIGYYVSLTTRRNGKGNQRHLTETNEN